MILTAMNKRDSKVLSSILKYIKKEYCCTLECLLFCIQ